MTTRSAPTPTEQIARGGTLFLVGGVAGRVLLYGGHLLLARGLPVSDVGLYFLGVTLVHGLCLLATLGLDVGLLREAPRLMAGGRQARLDAAIQGSLVACAAACLVFSAGLTALAPRIAGGLRQPGLEALLPFFAWALPALAFQRLSTSIFQALFRAPATILLRNLIYPALFVAGLVPVLAWYPSAGAVVLVLAVANGVPAMLGAVWLRRQHGLLRAREEARGEASLELLRFSFPILIAGIVGYAAQWMDSLLAGYFLEAEAVGRYSVALRLSLIGAILLEAFNGALGPAASSLFSRDRAALGPVYRDVTRLGLSIYLPVLGVMLLAPGALLGLFGQAYVDGETATALRILAVGQLVNVGVGGAGLLLVMVGRPWLNLFNGLALAAVNGALCLLLIPRFGVTGAAIAASAGVAAINLVRVLELRVLAGLHPFHRSFWKPLLAFGVALGAGAAVRQVAPGWAGAWTGVGALGFAYLVVLLASGLEEAERDLVRRVWRAFSGPLRSGG